MKAKANLDSHIISFLFQSDMHHSQNRKGTAFTYVQWEKNVSLCVSSQDSQAAARTIIAFESSWEVQTDICVQITKIMSGSEVKLEVTDSDLWTVFMSYLQIIFSCCCV